MTGQQLQFDCMTTGDYLEEEKQKRGGTREDGRS
jgi:hypothetical protein